MFKSFTTSGGHIQVGSTEAIFRAMVGLIEGAVLKNPNKSVCIALSGGSTPKSFYQWATHPKALSDTALQKIIWTTSDERCVPLESAESNFGNLDRDFLTPLSVRTENKLPWPVSLEPSTAAEKFNEKIQEKLGKNRGFDICFLGLGEDGHTASLFPHCDLIGQKDTPAFAATLWPERGWRLTITETGFDQVDLIVILAIGPNKAKILKDIHHGPFNPREHPAQVLQAFAGKTLWLVDEAAATLL